MSKNLKRTLYTGLASLLIAGGLGSFAVTGNQAVNASTKKRAVKIVKVNKHARKARKSNRKATKKGKRVTRRRRKARKFNRRRAHRAYRKRGHRAAKRSAKIGRRRGKRINKKAFNSTVKQDEAAINHQPQFITNLNDLKLNRARRALQSIKGNSKAARVSRLSLSKTIYRLQHNGKENLTESLMNY